MFSKSPGAEQRYRKLFENASEGIWQIDSEFRTLDLNDQMACMLGYAKEEIVGRDVRDFMAPEELENIERRLENRRRGLKEIYECRLLRKDGSKFWVQISGAPFLDANDEFIGSFGMISDISERKDAEEALRESDELKRLALEAAQLGTWEYNPMTRELSWDRRGRAIFGMTPDETIDLERFMAFVYPKDREAVAEAITAGLNPLNEENRVEGQFRIRRADGEIRWINANCKIYFATEKSRVHAVRVIGTMMDATERKRSERALKESESRFRMVVDNSWDGIHQLDLRNGRYIFASPSQERLTGFKTEELMFSMKEAAARVHPDDSESVRTYLKRIISGEKIDNPMEYRWRVKSGEYRWFSDSRQAVFDNSGKAISLVGITRDITETKQFQAELEKSKVVLEKTVAERTKLAEARANQLQALAVELIEAEERERRRIAQILHDDLQQILAAARMQLRAARAVLSENPELANVEHLLDESIQKSRRLSHELSPAVLHHFGLIAALRWLASHLGEQFGVRVDFEARTNKRYQSEPTKLFLFRAVRELLFNIVKHSGAKSGRVELSESDDCLLLSVCDTGIGFDPNFLNSFSAGAGLGLISIRERARFLGGDLQIESAVGRGSRFTLTIPLSLANAHDSRNLCPAAGNEPVAPAELEEHGAKAIRVLFADDHEVMRQGLLKLISGQPDIETAGEASNGREAIEQARNLKPDLILMDVSMPEMDGIEATRCIKGELPDVRVIGLSMLEDKQIARTMLEAGAEAFVSKTASPAELLSKIYAVARSDRRKAS